MFLLQSRHSTSFNFVVDTCLEDHGWVQFLNLLFDDQWAEIVWFVLVFDFSGDVMTKVFIKFEFCRVLILILPFFILLLFADAHHNCWLLWLIFWFYLDFDLLRFNYLFFYFEDWRNLLFDLVRFTIFFLLYRWDLFVRFSFSE